jgi:hypothetical protein
MANSKKIEDMKLFGDAFTDLFDKVADAHPDLAKQTLEMLEGINYNNYLTEEEATSILSKFVNQDGTEGPKWSFDMLNKFLDEQNLEKEEEGNYNFYALAVTMNMIYSDYANQLIQMLGDKKDELTFWVYRLTQAKLHDKDKPRWIRSYFLE